MKRAQITKMDFAFRNLMHSALVSISGDAEDMFIHIQLINSFVRRIFGVEHIRFHDHNGAIEISDVQHPLAYQVAELVNSKLKEEMKSDAHPRQLHSV